MAMELDALDRQLLGLLNSDCRQSYRSMAQQMASTTPTVSARVRRLERLGAVHGYRAQLDSSLLEGTLLAVHVEATLEASQAVQAILQQVPGAEHVLLLAGGSCQAILRSRDPAATLDLLHRGLAEVPGIKHYQAIPVLASLRVGQVIGIRTGVRMDCHYCKHAIQGEPARATLGGRPHVFCCRQCLAAFKGQYAKLAPTGT